MLNRQEQYWLECWRRSQAGPPAAAATGRRHCRLGAIKHGLYAARTLHHQLAPWLHRLYGVAYWLQPFLPETGTRVIAALSAEPIRASAPLFPRL